MKRHFFLLLSFIAGCSFLTQLLSAQTCEQTLCRDETTLVSCEIVEDGKGIQDVTPCGDNVRCVDDLENLQGEVKSVCSVCGDGFLDVVTEQCDDGNTSNDDGCSANCTNEACGDGTTQANEQCDDGNGSDNDDCKNNCTLNICGDGVLRNGFEQCDDGNTSNDDGCSAGCFVEICGDGTTQANEQCDDGNGSDNDDCKNNCTLNICGDGVLRNGFEQCDDTNTNNNDGCKNDCTVNICGDNVVLLGSESCDGSDLNGQSCTTLGQGFSGGSLACLSCSFDTVSCTF